MKFNEDRVKLFATVLRLLTNPEVQKELADKGEGVDFENLVRAIAEVVPLPDPPFAFPAGTYPNFPMPIQPLPMQPLIGDPLWPNSPQTICSGGTSDSLVLSAMSQADGMGDDSGRRGD